MTSYHRSVAFLLVSESLVLLGLLPSMTPAASSPVSTRAAEPMPAGEAAGPRPYEMVRAGRTPPQAPLVSFDSLAGWQVECTEGAVARLIGSQKQRVWESPVARLVYRGTSAKSGIILRPPAPIPVPGPVSATTIWIYGNNWSWVP